MSDTYQGHGWWQASDGKWYPPEQHPDFRPPPPPPPPPPPSGAQPYAPPYVPPAPSGTPPPGPFTNLGPSGLAGPIDSLGRPLSGWWRRFFAFAIDSIIILVPKVVLGAIALPSSNGSTVFSTGRVYLDVMLLALAWAVIDIVYFGYLNGGDSGQTVGQRWLGIAVRDEASGGPIGFQRAAVRILILNPSVLVSWIPVFGFLAYLFAIVAGLSPLWDQRKQGFHDKVERTVVIKVR